MFRYLATISLTVSAAVGYVLKSDTSCYVFPEAPKASGDYVDDTPSVLKAFDECGRDGSIILTDNTFHISQVMNTTDLLNCDVHLYGEMIWSTDVQYWLTHNFSARWNRLSTAWLFGGRNVSFQGHGKGVLNGNGRSHHPIVSLGSSY